ncbi:MAG: carboxypeptidase regulatory-like domain-containing protein [Planctomycetes bacterium]|nr:carboxypeptidase regulatory-like domain-containing protein [Planctomycetota bacterium]
MKRILIGLSIVTFLAVDVASVSAAWNNVFQTTLFGRRRRAACCPPPCCPTPVVAAAPVAIAAPVCNSCAPAPAPAPTVAYAAPAAPAPCGPQCTTSYTQRCYYTPVTTYQTQTYYEPVTTYRTSYYYEPVVSYRYSCYIDPCTCCPRQVATPVTSYQLREQACPVQRWVQRCASVPVTTYQQSCYWEPKTTCCQTTVGAPIPCGQPAPAAPPVVMQAPPATQPPPAVMEQRPPTSPPPVINEQRNGNGNYERYYPKPATYPAPANRSVTPPVRLDGIVFGPNASVEGQVVRSDRAARPNARVTFVSADRLSPTQTAFANSAGRFRINLPAGGWLVYLDAPNGTQIYHSRIDVSASQAAPITLVSR